jgi:hypothetical protein
MSVTEERVVAYGGLSIQVIGLAGLVLLGIYSTTTIGRAENMISKTLTAVPKALFSLL